MEQVIYGDVFFLVNFSMDFLALFLTQKLSHASVKFRRLVIGGVLGGLYATFALFLPTEIETITTLLFPFFLSCAVFGVSSYIGAIKKGLIFFAVSFVMGGVMTAVYYYAGRFLAERGLYINGEVETLYSDLPLWLIGLCAAWAAWIASLFSRYARKKAACRSVTITIGDGNRSLSLCALCDSGHFLEEPLSHLPVIVVGKKTLLSLLPQELTPLFFDLGADLSHCSPKLLVKLRFVPMATVGHEGLLRGYIPDAVWVGREAKKAILVCDETAEDFEGFDAILPPSLLP